MMRKPRIDFSSLPLKITSSKSEERTESKKSRRGASIKITKNKTNLNSSIGIKNNTSKLINVQPARSDVLKEVQGGIRISTKHGMVGGADQRGSLSKRGMRPVPMKMIQIKTKGEKFQSEEEEMTIGELIGAPEP